MNNPQSNLIYYARALYMHILYMRKFIQFIHSHKTSRRRVLHTRSILLIRNNTIYTTDYYYYSTTPHTTTTTTIIVIKFYSSCVHVLYTIFFLTHYAR